ncbi:MAG TPA: PAS domain S-box protein [Bacteroidia bacterium]|nr:PAS domain S-box protein [Bacteroidia bacterium]
MNIKPDSLLQASPAGSEGLITSQPIDSAGSSYLMHFLLALGVLVFLVLAFLIFFRSRGTHLSRSLQDEDAGNSRTLLEVRLFILATGFLALLTESTVLVFYPFSLLNAILHGLIFVTGLLTFLALPRFNIGLQRAEFLLAFLYIALSALLIQRFKNNSTDLLMFGLFCFHVFYSYSVFRSFRYFAWYAGGVALTFLLGYNSGYIGERELVIYLSTLFTLSLVNLARHVLRRNTEKYLLFTSKIVNQGSSLVVGSNGREELVFISENVRDILGYDRNELHSANWFKKTLAPEDSEDEIAEKIRAAKHNGKIYSRKMLTTWGYFKWIQWQYKKFGNDLWIGIGQDITEQIKIQQEYQNLIQSATDIIHKTDRDGNFVFFNRHLERLMGYKDNELIGKSHTSLVRKDHVSRMLNFYERSKQGKMPLETIEFPAVKKNGEEVWLSQNITVERDANGDILSYNSIVRDISLHKQSEQETLNKQLKIERNSKLLRELTFTCTSYTLDLNSILKQVIEKTAGGIKADRVSVWNCSNEHIQSSYFYERQDQKHWYKAIRIAKDDHPGYFNLLKRGEIVAAEDVNENAATKDFVNDYFQDHNTKSLLDVPIFIDGRLDSVLCSETYTQKRQWDSEDINFVRSVAGLLTIAIESAKRKQAEAQLAERGKVLAAIGKVTEQLLVSENVLLTLGEHLDPLGEALHADRVYLYGKQENHHSLHLVKAWYSKTGLVPCSENITQSLLYESINTFFTHHSRNFHLNLLTKQLKDEALRLELESQQVQSLLLLPIVLDGRLIGFLGADNCAEERTWSRDTIVLMNSLITNVVHALKRFENEVKIQESEANFRQINESIEDVFWLYDDIGKKYLYISPSCEKVLGMSQADFYAGKNFGDHFVLEEDLLEYRTAMLSLSTRESYELEYRIRTKDGQLRWISEKSSAIRNAKGELVRNSGICSDITEKKHFLNRIKQLSLVAEKTNNGILILDRNGFVLWANQSYLSILEVPMEKLLNKRPTDIFVYKTDPHIAPIETFNGTNYTRIFELQTYLGNRKWIEVSNTIIEDDEDQTTQQVQIITDITQKRVKDLELAQHRAMLRKYSSYLEYQNELKEKLLNISSIEEIAQIALKFVKENVKNCVHISLLTLDEKKQFMSGYYILDDKIHKERHSVKSFKSFDTVKTGEIFIENNLLDGIKSSSDSILLEYGAVSYVVLPMMDMQEIIGQLTITFNAPFNFSDTELENLKNLAINFSTTIQKINLKNFLQEKNNDIRDSLNYARNIQKTVLPDLGKNLPALSNVVLLFEPKDIVSGDFYWARETGRFLFVALGDCTGHGVPGAFLTIIGTRILEQIVIQEKYPDPSSILAEFDRQLYLSLNAGHNEMIRDGMEIALCMIDKTTRQFHFSGVGMGLVYYLNDQEIYIKGLRGSIGDYKYNEVEFETTSFELTGKEVFYMSSDGYQDQLGGLHHKRFSKRRLLDLLNDIRTMDSRDQEAILKQTIREHMKDHFQTDDISLLGFTLNLTTS